MSVQEGRSFRLHSVCSANRDELLAIRLNGSRCRRRVDVPQISHVRSITVRNINVKTGVGTAIRGRPPRLEKTKRCAAVGAGFGLTGAADVVSRIYRSGR